MFLFMMHNHNTQSNTKFFISSAQICLCLTVESIANVIYTMQAGNELISQLLNSCYFNYRSIDNQL